MDKLVEGYARGIERSVGERYAELLSRNAPVDTGELSASFEVEDYGGSVAVTGLYYGKMVDDDFVEVSVEELELDLDNGFV